MATPPTPSSPLTCRITIPSDPAILLLTAALEAELNTLYSAAEREMSQSQTSSIYPPPQLTYLIAESPTGEALGCIAFFVPPAHFFADLPSTTTAAVKVAELTRMYMAPPSRGTGLSTALLQRMEAIVREKFGVDVVVLRTGVRQGPAIRLYERAGYVRRALYGEYVGGGPEDGRGGVSVALWKDLRTGMDESGVEEI